MVSHIDKHLLLINFICIIEWHYKTRSFILLFLQIVEICYIFFLFEILIGQLINMAKKKKISNIHFLCSHQTLMSESTNHRQPRNRHSIQKALKSKIYCTLPHKAQATNQHAASDLHWKTESLTYNALQDNKKYNTSFACACTSSMNFMKLSSQIILESRPFPYYRRKVKRRSLAACLGQNSICMVNLMISFA